ILKLANREKVPVTVRGGGTSAAGGVTPVYRGGILLDMTDMDSILSVDLDRATVTVEAGVSFGQLAAELHPKNVTMCLGGHAIYSATVGGCISNTSVSVGSGYYGMFGEQVVSVKVVTPKG